MTNYITDTTCYYAQTISGKIYYLGQCSDNYDCGGGIHNSHYGHFEEEIADDLLSDSNVSHKIGKLSAEDFRHYLTQSRSCAQDRDIQMIIDWNDVTEEIVGFCVIHSHMKSPHYGGPHEFPDMWCITAEGIQAEEPRGISCKALRHLVCPDDIILCYCKRGERSVYLYDMPGSSVISGGLSISKLDESNADFSSFFDEHESDYDGNEHSERRSYLCVLLSDDNDLKYPRLFLLTE